MKTKNTNVAEGLGGKCNIIYGEVAPKILGWGVWANCKICDASFLYPIIHQGIICKINEEK